MKKSLMLVSILFCLTATLSATILTQPGSGTGYVGDDIGFYLTCSDDVSCNWYWGDGQSLLDADDSTSWVYHIYRNPGEYTVHLHRYGFVSTPSCMVDEYVTVRILENRTITADPAMPFAGQPITFTATNFNTPTNITWNMGDGTVLTNQSNMISHTYAVTGTYTIKAYDWNGNTQSIPVTLAMRVAVPQRAISYSPAMPRVDQPVDIRAVSFNSESIDWNFGDGTPPQTYSALVSHRYQNPGTFTITAKEHNTNVAPASRAITILPENRFLLLSAPELRPDEPLIVTAKFFRDKRILWDFGDRTVVSGPATMTHIYKRPGDYIISARDENGSSQKKIQVPVRILGINDEVNLEIAEITLDNGKYYKVVPKNSKNIKAQLKLKMRGTGIVSGYWIVDNQPYQFFNETVYQGQIKTIFTQEIPGLPAFDPGMHTITMQLTRPQADTVVFPTLRYFVLPFENEITTLAPRDGAIIKEDESAKFSWQEAPGGSYYQVAFANTLIPLLRDDAAVEWLDCPDRFSFVPDAETWKSIKRNQWSYWKVRAMDSTKNIVAESNIQEIKVIVPGAEIGIKKITDMDGNNISIGSSFTAAKADHLLVQGYLAYPAEAEYLILQVYANDSKVDQLLFRNVKKDEKRMFETSVPNMEKECRLVFQVLKSSSPSVIIGYSELKLKKE